MYRPRALLIAVLWVVWSVVGPSISGSSVQAQSAPLAQPPAEVWLSQILKEQRRMGFTGRWIAAPLSVALGGAAASVPIAVDTSLSSTIAYLGSGAFMLTSALATWANEDPDAARRAAALWGSLGFSAFGAGLVLSCVEPDDVCAAQGIGRRLQIGVGVFEAGFWLSNTIFMLFMPPPSASALELSVKNVSAAERHARVLDFLERRDRQRRAAAYIGAPWGVALGIHLLANGADAAAPEGKAWLYCMGAGLIAFNVGLFLYDQLRRGDADKLRASEYP